MVTKRINKYIFIIIALLPWSLWAELIPRDLDGDPSNGHEAVYDNVLNVTWLANANLVAAQSFGVVGLYTDPDFPGAVSWNKANEWLAALNAVGGGAGYLGINSWRLPSVAAIDSSGYDTSFTYDGSSDVGYQQSAPVSSWNPNGQSPAFTGNELAYHYYNNLAAFGWCYGVGAIQTACQNIELVGIDRSQNTANLALFNSFLEGFYWSGTEVTGSASDAFIFSTNTGVTTLSDKNSPFTHVWPLADGDWGEPLQHEKVPVPVTFLFVLGMALSFMGIAVKKRNSW